MEYEDNRYELPSEAHHQMNQPTEQLQAMGVSPSSSVLTYLGLGQNYSATDGPEHLLASLHDPQWSVRVAAVRKLGRLHLPTHIPSLLCALQDQHSAVRAAAARALGNYGAYTPITALVEALNDPSWHVRAAAISALGKQDEHIPLEPILPLLHDEDESVRATAAWAIGKCGEHAPIDPLVQACQDTSWSVREAALHALGSLGPRVPGEPLLAARSDMDSAVCQAAEEALHQTHPELFALPVLNASPLPLWEDDKVASASPPSHEYADPITEDLPFDETVLVHSQDEYQPFAPVDWLHAIVSSHEAASRSASPDHTSLQPRPEREAAHSTPLPVRATPRKQKSARQQSIFLFLERGIAAAILVGIALSWFLLSQHMHTSTASTNIPTLFSYHGNVGGANKLAWVPQNASIVTNGDKAIAFTDKDDWVEVWDTDTKQNIASYGPFNKIAAMTWTMQGLYVADLRQDGGAIQLRYADHAPFLTIPLRPGTTTTVSWQPDAQGVAVASSTATSSTIQIWEASKNWRSPIVHQQPGVVQALSWSANGTMIASASEGANGQQHRIDIWNAISGESLIASNAPTPYISTPSRVIALSWAPDASQSLAYALANDAVYLHNSSTNTDTNLTPPDGKSYWSLLNPTSKSSALAWSPDGKRLAAATSTDSILVWDNAGNLLYTYTGHSTPISAIAWSSDNISVLSLSTDGTLLMWQAR